MRGKVKACDSCRKKKVRCNGSTPLCKYCLDHSLECTYNYVPKKIAPYVWRKNSSAVSVSVKPTSIAKKFKIDKTTETKSCLKNIESLLENVLKKLDTYDNQTRREVNNMPTGFETDESFTNTESGETAVDCLQEKSLVVSGIDNNSSFESYDKMFFGDHFSVSFFSVNGLMWAADRLKDPFVLNPLKKLISNFVAFERSLLSCWTDPVDTSRLASLPSREIMNIIIDSYIEVDLYGSPYLNDVKELACRYCNYRDGLAPQPGFNYGQLLYLNSCLLIGSSVYFEKINIGLAPGDHITCDQLKEYEKLLLDNTIYYAHKVSVIGGGIDAIKGLTLLCFYAEIFSFTQPLYSMTSLAIRLAQELGLHRENYYHHLNDFEEFKMSSLWWVCYVFDKFSFLKTGKPPTIIDDFVTAPPALLDFQEYYDDSGKNGPRASLKRNYLHKEISETFDLSRLKGYNQLSLIMEVDLSCIISKLYNNLLLADPTNSSVYLENAKNLLNDLEAWKLCLPESIRPGGVLASAITVSRFNGSSVTRFFIVSNFSLQYYYLKLIISILASRSLAGSEQTQFKNQGLETARELLKFAVAIAQRVVQSGGIYVFFSFSAFLTIAAFCIQEPTSDGVTENVRFLIFCFSELFSGFSKSKGSPEVWITIGAVSRCVLYIVVHVVMEHNENVYFDVGDLLNEVSEIQRASNYDHFSSYVHGVSTKSQKHIARVSEIPISSSSGERGNNINLIGDSINTCLSPNMLENKDQIPNPSMFPHSDFDNFLGLINESLPTDCDFISDVLFPMNGASSNGDFKINNPTTSHLDELFNVDDFSD